MKHNTKITLAAALAILLLAGCGMIRTAAHAETDAPAGDYFAEAFSARDLSGKFADEVFRVTLNGAGAVSDSDRVRVSGSVVTITGAGTYILSGTLDNGSIIVDAAKEDKVQLVLDGVSINADSFAAVYVIQADKVFVTLAEGTENSLTNGGSFSQIDDSRVDAVIFSREDLTLNGTGTLKIHSPDGHGIDGKDEVTFGSGSYEIQTAKHAVRAKDSIAVADGSFTITAKQDGLHAENGSNETLGNILIANGSFTIQSGDDAIHANTFLQIDGGNLEISAAEGLEGTYIRINGGNIRITAVNDGINATQKSSAYPSTAEINGGELDIVMRQGDNDGVDSNGSLIINGGSVSVTGKSAFDCAGSVSYNGGTVIVNGQQVDSIPVG